MGEPPGDSILFDNIHVLQVQVEFLLFVSSRSHKELTQFCCYKEIQCKVYQLLYCSAIYCLTGLKIAFHILLLLYIYYSYFVLPEDDA